MTLKTLLSALRKCERIIGAYQDYYRSDTAAKSIKCKRLADKIEKRILEMFEGEKV